MGLDMYLTAKVYVGAEFEFKNVRFNTASMRVGYWRKANAIHAWFVENVQDGEDECQEAYVSRDQLEALLGLCNKVLRSHKLAPVLLPTQSGFFFGDTSYDEYYFDDVRDTVKIIKECLSYEPGVSFYYQSSW